MPDRHETVDERARRLPLVTETATVTAVDAIDDRRGDEIRDAVERHFDEWDLETPADPLDWDAVFDRLDPSAPDTVRRHLRTLRERHERPYPSLVRLELDPADAFDFAPGQYATIRFERVPRPYSIASSPNDDALELCIRRVPGGHLTDRLFADVRAGETIPELRGPNGRFTLREPSDRDLVFLATGTGIAPLRSMIRYVFQEGRDEHEGTTRDVWLFHGCSWRDDLAFSTEFDALAADRENFHYVPTLSRESLLSDWDGETAYVQSVFLKHLADGVDAGALSADLADALDRDPANDPGVRIDPEHADVYACGLTAMVAVLETVTRAVGVPDRAFRSERFG